MKKLIVIPLLCFCLAVGAQEKRTTTKTKTTTTEMNSDQKSATTMASLDGKAFKVTFTEVKDADMQSSGRANSQTQNRADVKKDKDMRVNPNATPEENAGATAETHKTWKMANGKAVLRFEEGKVYSSILSKHANKDKTGETEGMNQSNVEEMGCPYNVTTSSGDMVLFTAVCRIKTGEKMMGSSESWKSSNETSTTTTGTPTQSTSTMGNQDQTTGTQTTTTTSTQSKTWSDDKGMKHTKTATISGTVSGNSIRGTLSWTDLSGNTVQYSFTGAKATSKDIDADRNMSTMLED